MKQMKALVVIALLVTFSGCQSAGGRRFWTGVSQGFARAAAAKRQPSNSERIECRDAGYRVICMQNGKDVSKDMRCRDMGGNIYCDHNGQSYYCYKAGIYVYCN